MIVAIDVDYREQYAQAAGVLFDHWHSQNEHSRVIKQIKDVAPYEPGAFFRRELPCIQAVLEEIAPYLAYILIDGYVTLGLEQRPGLGMHLYHSLSKQIPVIGIAKKPFSQTPKDCELLRGESKKPLFITAAGMSLTEAKSKIADMHGQFRLPTMIKKADTLCRVVQTSP